MNIRPATVSDVPGVLPMVGKIAAFHEKLDPAKYSYRPDTTARYAGWLSQRAEDDRSVFLVADVAGGKEPPRVVGFLIGTVEKEIPIFRLTEFGFIHDLWVDDEYRHEGAGRQLVMQAIERFAAIGVKQVRLDVLLGNTPAKGVFEACGFRASIAEMLLELGDRG